MPDTTDKCELINFEPLTRTAAITQAATTHLCLDLFNGQLKACRQPFKHNNKSLSMRFTSSQQAEHEMRLSGASREFCFCR
jgi:hypothetical protein